jgi:hypothetical protein
MGRGWGNADRHFACSPQVPCKDVFHVRRQYPELASHYLSPLSKSCQITSRHHSHSVVVNVFSATEQLAVLSAEAAGYVVVIRRRQSSRRTNRGGRTSRKPPPLRILCGQFDEPPREVCLQIVRLMWAVFGRPGFTYSGSARVRESRLSTWSSCPGNTPAETNLAAEGRNSGRQSGQACRYSLHVCSKSLLQSRYLLLERVHLLL